MNKTIKIENMKSYIVLIIISIIFLILSLQNITSPFIHVSEDTNGQNGLAALNTLKYGIATTKLGLYVSWLDGNKNFDDLTGNFYANHPSFFIIPTIILYKIFGVNEATTRLGPLSLIFLSLILFFFALKKIFNQNLFLVFISLFIFIILPGTIYYSKHLDPSPPVLAASLISYSLFIFYYFNPKKLYLYLFFISIIFGIAMGWHYAAMPAALWLFIITSKTGRKTPNKKYLLIFIPLILTLAIFIQFFHIYLLNGIKNVNSLVFESYGGRSGFYMKYFKWWETIYQRSKLNFTSLFLYTFLIGFIFWLYNIFKPKNKIEKNKMNLNSEQQEFCFMAPLIIMPIMVTLFFQQWSTHPFGVIFYLPAVAILSGFVLYKIYQKNNGIGILLSTIILAIGFFMSISNLNFFYKNFLILDPNDITLFKELKNNINSKELCLGRNQTLYFGGIVGFYLQKEILFSPQCLEKNNQNIKYVLAFNPKFDQIAAQDFELFIKNNFKLQGCSGAFCLMQK